MNLRTTKESVLAEIQNNVKAATDDAGNLLFKEHRFSSLSKTNAILRALAWAVYLFVDQVLLVLLKAIHPHTSEEDDLREWLRRHNLEWKDAVAAQHNIRIGSSDPVVLDRAIGQGLIVTTAGLERNRIRFRILQSVTLSAGTAADSRGYHTVAATCECLLTGPIGNVAKDTISLIEGAPDGVDIVYNPDDQPLLTGAARETIAQARARVQTVEDATVSMWTPGWYKAQAEAHSNVARAVFKSSKQLGIPGAIKLWALARSGSLSPAELQAIVDDIESEAKSPGGCARVLIEQFTTVPVNKTVRVRFADNLSIPDQTTLDEVYDSYFTGLTEHQNYVETDLKNLYLALPRSVQVVMNPAGDISVGAGQVAVPGSSFSVIGEVYTG